MNPFRLWTYLFCSILWSAIAVESVPDLTRNHNLTLLENDPLAVLGIPDTRKLKTSWGLTVNDQCLYEFVYKFEHPDDFPIGDEEHDGTCDFGTMDDPVKPKRAPDKIPYLKSRRYWERFPDYVWATLGFNHLSMDWVACGRKPAGYRHPQYELSFYRVTPEYRVNNMVCRLYDEPYMTVVPHQDYCHTEQEDINGYNFFITPGAMVNMDPQVNMPVDFTPRYLTFGPMPYEGLRAWDEKRVPDTPEEWNDLPVFMSTYAGNLVMWQAHVPYKFISGEKRQFHSLAQRYYETTIQTLPDTWAVKYDERDGHIYFTMVGKAELCREDFERAEKASRGPPIFPNYFDQQFTETETPTAEDDSSDSTSQDDSSDTGDNSNKEEDSSRGSYTSVVSTMIIQVLVMVVALAQLL